MTTPSRASSRLATLGFVLGCLSLISLQLLLMVGFPEATLVFSEQFLGWATLGAGILPLVLGTGAILCGFSAWFSILKSRGVLKGKVLGTIGILMAVCSLCIEITGIQLMIEFHTCDPPAQDAPLPALFPKPQPINRKESIMAIVFEANYSKKLGLPGFSSHQYSLTIRSELSDLKQVHTESNRLYKLLQDSVDKEIQQTGFLPNGNGSNGSNGGNGRQEHKDTSNGDWACSEKQKELILKIVNENDLDKQEIESLAQDRFGKGVKELNRLEASGLIEELLEKHGSKDNGNGRSQRRFPTRRYQGASK